LIIKGPEIYHLFMKNRKTLESAVLDVYAHDFPEAAHKSFVEKNRRGYDWKILSLQKKVLDF